MRSLLSESDPQIGRGLDFGRGSRRRIQDQETWSVQAHNRQKCEKTAPWGTRVGIRNQSTEANGESDSELWTECIPLGKNSYLTVSKKFPGKIPETRNLTNGWAGLKENSLDEGRLVLE